MIAPHLSGPGLLLVESLTLVTSSSELLRFLQTMGIALAHEPSQIKLEFPSSIIQETSQLTWSMFVLHRRSFRCRWRSVVNVRSV